MTKTIDVKPLPVLSWNGYSWNGTTKLNSWKGFQTRMGPYGAVSSDQPSDGTVKLYVSWDDQNALRLPDAFVRGFEYLVSNEAAIAAAVKTAIFEKYPKIREEYFDVFEEEYVDEVMPAISTMDDLRQIMGLHIIHILDVQKNGLAYVGFEFGCTWEEEHGMGVMTHQDRVLYVEEAAESFNGYRGIMDGGTEVTRSG